MSARVIWRPEPLTARLIAAATPAAHELAAVAAERAPHRVRHTVRAVGTGEHFTVGTTDPVGGYAEFGTRPHEITPRNKQAMKFRDGTFATVAQHPGAKAKPWLRPTLPLWGPLYRRNASAAFRGF